MALAAPAELARPVPLVNPVKTAILDKMERPVETVVLALMQLPVKRLLRAISALTVPSAHLDLLADLDRKDPLVTLVHLVSLLPQAKVVAQDLPGLQDPLDNPDSLEDLDSVALPVKSSKVQAQPVPLVPLDNPDSLVHLDNLELLVRAVLDLPDLRATLVTLEDRGNPDATDLPESPEVREVVVAATIVLRLAQRLVIRHLK